MKSLRGKIFWSFVSMALVASLSAMGLTVFLLLKQSEREAKQRIQQEEKNLLSLGVMDFISLVEYRDFIDQISTSIPSDQLSEIIRIYIPPGVLLYSNHGKIDLKNPQKNLTKYVDRDFYSIAQDNHEHLALLRSYKTSDGKTLWLEIATLRTTQWTAIKSIAGLFVGSFFILIGLAFLFSFWLGRKISSPIESFAEDISKLDPKDIKTWKIIPAKYEEMREMKPIANAFNMFKDRLQQIFIRNEYIGRFIAHEIRTPLTIIQGEIELTGDRIRSTEEVNLTKSILEEVNKISDVVETVLKIPYGDRNSSRIQIEKNNLPTLLHQIIEDLRKGYRKNIELSDNLPPDLEIDTDPYLFAMLISNLVRNAHQHGFIGAPILIRSYVREKKAVIEIIDQGNGLPTEVLVAANSQDKFSKDLGIGLLLSKQIAELLRHQISFENLSNQGLCVKIYISLYE